VSFSVITVYVASQRVILKISVYFVIDSVRELLDTPSYMRLTKLSVFITVRASVTSINFFFWGGGKSSNILMRSETFHIRVWGGLGFEPLTLSLQFILPTC